jgi:hypothetical protein
MALTLLLMSSREIFIKGVNLAAPSTKSFMKPRQQLPPFAAAWAITFSAIDLITGSLIWLLTLSNYRYSPLLLGSFCRLRLFFFCNCMSAEFLGSSTATVQAKGGERQGAVGHE